VPLHIGGVFGGILAGYVSDRFNARSLTCAGFVYLSIPVLYMYREYGRGHFPAQPEPLLSLRA